MISSPKGLRNIAENLEVRKDLDGKNLGMAFRAAADDLERMHAQLSRVARLVVKDCKCHVCLAVTAAIND